MDEKAMYKLTYGLFVVTASREGKQNGCIVNTVQQVTSQPNRISVAINKSNFTHDMVMETRKFNVSILSQAASFDLFKRFGFQSGRDVDKFAGFTGYNKALNDINYITEGTNAYISAWVEQTVDLGTHTLFIAAVTNMETLNDVPSVTYDYYQRNIKPKPQPKEGPKEGKTVWVCKICGYEYEGDPIPDDFICPLCKHPASDFEKQIR
jgi:flavin reductase (DIM6/NTAB) family NADH-FMN oxidoreductase RutF